MCKYIDDIKNYDKNPDTKAIEKLSSDLRLIMQDQDARYVAVSDEKELELVAKNFAMDKLDVDIETAKKAVHEVAQLMSSETKKNRIIFYYLVAKQLGKLKALYL
ncbi:DUF2853 family protein [Bartonella sp. TP]|uniref:DUF2853 family protein n=1 Tax=Bartonella sp. TP TaxID=3057550 RepID=UPI0025B0CF9C|nr:DUF2853 family protein [Bartonella sp. TP]WJW79779.1 DUF2853 family protein [Bartonella sp. TP]